VCNVGMRRLCSRMGRARGRMTAFGAGVVVFLKNLFFLGSRLFLNCFVVSCMSAIQVSHGTTGTEPIPGQHAQSRASLQPKGRRALSGVNY
jgi:energy-converting hydrogenase Eha subunit B